MLKLELCFLCLSNAGAEAARVYHVEYGALQRHGRRNGR